MKVLWTAALAALLCLRKTQTVRAAADGFEDQLVMDSDFMGGGIITDFVWTPGGSLLVVKKEGFVDVFGDPNGDNSYSERTQALDISALICDNSERGVEGIEVHPDFETNRFVYLYYTFNKNGNCDEDPFIGPVNRLSRFILPESNIIDPNSETLFFETPSLEYDHHNSGDIAFGNDGNLYISVGDGGSTFSALAQNPGNLFGSMIRLTDDGGIPSTNPYTFQSGETSSVRCNETGLAPEGSPEGAKCQEIFAIGLRNPFRFSMDPNTEDKVRLYFNDVGQAIWEEVSEITSDDAGANYGWPIREGPCPNSKRTNCAEPHDFKDPVHFYIHDGGGAATGMWRCCDFSMNVVTHERRSQQPMRFSSKQVLPLCQRESGPKSMMVSIFMVTMCLATFTF
jgi:glucose/arabinose dehydrogenase